jgi:hypothetical protein
MFLRILVPRGQVCEFPEKNPKIAGVQKHFSPRSQGASENGMMMINHQLSYPLVTVAVC